MKTNVLALDAKDVLEKQILTISQLTFDEYVQPLRLISNSSIGGHTRHIIELFQCLLAGYQTGIINYDSRVRDSRIQTNIDFAIECMAIIISELDRLNIELSLVNDTYQNAEAIKTNYNRELLYNIEHCIHHQAIIKIALEILQIENIDGELGIAKSTLQYRRQCAQ